MSQSRWFSTTYCTFWYLSYYKLTPNSTYSLVERYSIQFFCSQGEAHCFKIQYEGLRAFLQQQLCKASIQDEPDV